MTAAKSFIAAAALAAGLAITAAPAQAATVIGATQINITNALGTYLQVAEVVATAFGTGVDVAASSHGGSATALDQYSGTLYSPGPSAPANAIDGDTGGDYYTDLIYHAQGAGELSIHFGATTLSSLTLYGRTDCCSERDDYHVSILNAAGTELYSGTLDARGGPVTVNFDAPPAGGAVPEPAAWALMLTGFFGAGSVLRRRRAALAAA